LLALAVLHDDPLGLHCRVVVEGRRAATASWNAPRLPMSDTSRLTLTCKHRAGERRENPGVRLEQPMPAEGLLTALTERYARPGEKSPSRQSYWPWKRPARSKGREILPPLLRDPPGPKSGGQDLDCRLPLRKTWPSPAMGSTLSDLAVLDKA